MTFKEWILKNKFSQPLSDSEWNTWVISIASTEDVIQWAEEWKNSRISEKEFNKILSEPVLGLFEESYIEEKLLGIKKNQELEDAAEQSSKSIGDLCSRASHTNGFKDGANWYKEKAGNDAVEFMRWTRSQSCGYVIGGDNRNRKLNTTSFITDQELYELWKQSKQNKQQ